ncbi:MAG: metallophosphoesterase [Rhodococcus sp. (in: high G+C Gram-positive bacteria)]|uniref:metallophosphoesterase n=1 Tax=Rhodococcus sp. EPR-157 TaxID=1813677 RepID=UPI0007BC6252|nr:metallophosphoesterase [Rhodococcus sp. EPR-157]KZF12098.1 metallophosphoesterase [Rhodococcus sp. EPR-157]
MARTGPTEVDDVASAPRRLSRRILVTSTVVLVVVLLFGVPLWTVFFAGSEWPTALQIAGCVLVGGAAFALPAAMAAGHARGSDRAARIGDTLLGAVWVLFVWSALGALLGLILGLVGFDDPLRSRTIAVAVVIVVAGLLVWGHYEAMRVPRVLEREVRIPRLGTGLDGLRVVLITDTHYGPIDRAAWSAKVVEKVNELDADIACHIGDLADGSVARRRHQVEPLRDVRARHAKVYVTGNHEYFGEAQAWLEHMESIGWTALHNKHIEVRRGTDELVIAGVDDRTAAGSSTEGHGADLDRALNGADPELPVFLLAHQPKQIDEAVRRGVDLQVSGHTHGGQIWPFEYLVRLDQPTVHGLSTHGDRTQLYTSRGTGYWGPPFRVFAPSEITVLTLRSTAG